MKNALNYNHHESSIQGVTGDQKGERLLELSLPALVMGQKATGKRFQESTELLSISSEQARFLLKAPIKIGALLKLSLKVPATPFLIYPLKLQVSGRVSRVEIDGHKKFVQLVTIRLERRFKLQAVSGSQDS